MNPQMKIEILDISSNLFTDFEFTKPVYDKVIATTRVIDETEILLWCEGYLAGKKRGTRVIDETEILLWCEGYLNDKKRH